MGQVQEAMRSAFPQVPIQLHTLSRRAPFWLAKLDQKGIVIELGQSRKPTSLEWECLEGIPRFLDGRGWVMAGGMNLVYGEPGTLDGYLKDCTTTNTSRWVVRLLRDAGVVDARVTPVKIRLTPTFAR